MGVRVCRVIGKQPVEPPRFVKDAAGDLATARRRATHSA
jgi:hypothetical protein